MHKSFIISCLVGAGLLALAGCQPRSESLPPVFTPSAAPSLTLTAAQLSPTPSETPVPSATPVPLPTVTLPAPLPFHGTLTSGLEMRFGQGGLGGSVLSPDGNYLAVVSGLGIILYNPETFVEVRILPEEARLGALAWSPDGKKLAVVTDLKTVTIWDALKAQRIQKLVGSDDITCLVWSPDGEKIALANRQRMVVVWDLKLAKPGLSFIGHVSRLDHWQQIFEIRWVSDTRIVSMDEAQRVLLWDAGSGDIIHTWEKSADYGFIRQIALSPDKKVLAINGFKDQELSLWDLVSLREIKTISGLPFFLSDLAWSPDQNSLAMLSQFPSKISSMDLNSGIIQKEFPTNFYRVDGLVWLKNGRELITRNGYGDGDVVTLWDLQTGLGLRGLRGLAANLVVWSPDGKTIASSDGKAIALWDVRFGSPRLLTGEIRNGILNGGGPNYESVLKMAFNPDGSQLAAESGDDSSRVRIWDTTTGQLLEGNWINDHLYNLFWSSGQQVIAQTLGKVISVWRPGNWKNHYTIDLSVFKAGSLDISPDGTLVAIGTDSTVEIRKPGSDEILRSWNVDLKPGFRLSWSPDARKIVLKSDENQLVVYEAASGKKLAALVFNDTDISGLKWSPDNSTIVCITWTPAFRQPGLTGTGKIYLWHLTEPAARLVNSRVLTNSSFSYFNIGSLSFSPDGKQLALALGVKGLVVIRP